VTKLKARFFMGLKKVFISGMALMVVGCFSSGWVYSQGTSAGQANKEKPYPAPVLKKPIANEKPYPAPEIRKPAEPKKPAVTAPVPPTPPAKNAPAVPATAPPTPAPSPAGPKLLKDEG
jgi:hypothetical protein